MIEITITIDGVGYGIGRIPGRKKLALYSVSPMFANPVAYFATDDDAERFAEFFERVAVSPPALVGVSDGGEEE